MTEVRAAAYLATVQRLDRKNSSGTIKCKPPNERCGGRCIPPSWDCRLKGEGSDPHLRAVKTDPLKGLASIERGTTRLFKGISKGSFSDVEGGKAAIIRGTVKIAPGDLQQKKQLQADLENNTRYIGIGLAVITGGLGVHAILMRSNFRGYRYNVGAKIEAATREGINKVLDATPLIGQHRAQNSSAVKQLVSETAYRIRSQQLQGPDTLRGTLGKGGEASLAGVSLSSDLIDSASALNTRLTGINEAFRSKNLSNSSTAFEKWNKGHRKGFWSVNETSSIGGRKPNIFARPTAESYLKKQYNLTSEESATRQTIEAALVNRISEEKATLIRLAKQQGYKVKRTADTEMIDADDISSFVSSLTRNNFSSSTVTQSLQRSVQEHLTSTITNSASDNASRIYRDTVRGFDNYFNSVGVVMADVRRSTRINPDQRSRGYSEIIQAADKSRSNYLASAMNLQRAVAGDSHAELINRAYYATRVSGTANSSYYVSERLARSAASEIAGRPINTNEEAYRLLTTQYGFTGASKTQIKTTTTRSPRVAALLEEIKSVKEPGVMYFSDGRKMTVGWSERVRRVLAREGNENMSTDAAFKIAQAEQKNQKKGGSSTKRGDSLTRTATYLVFRNDLREGSRLGKPCGASHIPKAHECRKGSAASPPSAKSQQNIKTAASVALAAGAVTGAAILISSPKARQRVLVQSRLITRGSDKTVRQALMLGGRGSVAVLSTNEIKKGLNKLPLALQNPARRLVGSAKQGAAAMALKAEGFSIQDIDVVNNYSTWKNKQGTIMSIGSYGDSLVTYISSRSHIWNNKPVYKIGFNVDQNFDATRTIPTNQAKTITSAVRKMTDNHLLKINDGVLATFPWDGDEYGSKRRSIYSRAGFNNIVNEDSQWALVKNGRIKKMTDAEAFIYLAESGERDAPIYKAEKKKRTDVLLKFSANP